MPLEISAIKDLHAHVYFEPGVTEDAAARLRARVAEAFPGALLGRWHAVPIGPHTRAMYQIAFPVELFPTLVPWLMLNRDTTHAAWLGEKLPLRMEASADVLNHR